MKKRISAFVAKVKKIKLREAPKDIVKSDQYRKLENFGKRKPFTTFIIGLVILFGIIFISHFLTTLNRPEVQEKDVVKSVTVYGLNGTPSISMQAKVEKAGVIQILAQSSGIVSQVSVTEGDTVTKGQTLVSLSSNYQGGNTAGLQYQLANTQYQNVADTFDTQKDILKKQREIAEKTEDNAEELRKIASDSASDTKSLLELNQNILDTISKNLTDLENAPVKDEALIFQTKQQKSQVQSGVVQLQSQLRMLDYQKDGGKPAGQLNELQRDITLKQLEVQEKALTLSLEIGRIQRDLAGVAAAMMTPAAPCGGVVERVFVKPGDTVNAGTPIATIKSGNPDVTLEALVPADIALSISRSTPSTILVAGKEVKQAPFYVSREATSGALYSVLYNISESNTEAVADGSFLVVKMPIGYRMTTAVPYVPLDAVYQTQSDAYVFIVNGDRAVSKKVQLGEVYGRFVTVLQGLGGNDEIILNRTIVSGDRIKVQR